MPIQATVILDSGCFLPMYESNGEYTEIGYFESSKSVSDIRVVADGNEVNDSTQINLGKKCVIEIRHVKADGTINRDGIRGSDGFHKKLLHLKELYGVDIPVDRAKFDCVIRFDTGLFCAALVKPRKFKMHKKQADGRFAVSPDDTPKPTKKPIAHNVHVHFRLKNGEVLEIARGEEILWSSKDTPVKERLEVEIIADNTTAEKFYRMALQGKRDDYWLPNQGDPPPMCPGPPCFP